MFACVNDFLKSYTGKARRPGAHLDAADHPDTVHHPQPLVQRYFLGHERSALIARKTLVHPRPHARRTRCYYCAGCAFSMRRRGNEKRPQDTGARGIQSRLAVSGQNCSMANPVSLIGSLALCGLNDFDDISTARIPCLGPGKCKFVRFVVPVQTRESIIALFVRIGFAVI